MTKVLTKIPPQSELLFSSKEIDNLVQKMASEISLRIKSSDAKSQPPLFVGILKGAFIFLADLVRKLDVPVDIDFVKASSYGSGTQSSGHIRLDFTPTVSTVEGRDVFLVDEIIDTGRTLLFLKDHFLQKGARKVHVVSLLDKSSRREVPIEADIVGITIPDEFVIGYGLDWDEKYRDLSEIRIVKLS